MRNDRSALKPDDPAVVNAFAAWWRQAITHPKRHSGLVEVSGPLARHLESTGELEAWRARLSVEDHTCE